MHTSEGFLKAANVLCQISKLHASLDTMEDEDVNVMFGCIRRGVKDSEPEDIEGCIPNKWKLKGGIVMDLSARMSGISAKEGRGMR